jgi:predicted transposase YdaD
MGVNSKYKDSVFSFLFSNPDVLRELYCALEGVSLPPDVRIDVNTLSGVLYMEQINDVSFTIDNRLVVLIEHQSTINQNMPLRLLIYIARVYEKMIERKRLYQSRMEMIPEPEFIVLYNGKAPYPDHKVLKLSDAFKCSAGLKATIGSAALELVVQVYNINQGHNPGLLEKSKILENYSFFVGKIREYEQNLPREEAMKAAIKHCLENNILKQFLETHSSEVFNMLITEWDTEEAKAAWYEEGMEEGMEKGREEIARNALSRGISLEVIHDITGLDIEAIKNIQNR